MNDELYHKAVMRMAATSEGAGGLDNPDASATADNPLCGDRVTMDVSLSDGMITEIGHKVLGCVLCQASASAIGAHAVGQRADSVEGVRAGIQAMLDDGQDSAPEPWAEDLAAFRPVAPHKSRHQCVLLPFDALIAAVDSAIGQG